MNRRKNVGTRRVIFSPHLVNLKIMTASLGYARRSLFHFGVCSRKNFFFIYDVCGDVCVGGIANSVHFLKMFSFSLRSVAAGVGTERILVERLTGW